MKLLNLLEEYKVRTHPKETTERLFKLAVRQFSLTLLRHAEVEDLTEERMAQHVVRRQLKGTAAGTIAGEQRKLYALWRFACKQNYLKVWPTSHPVRVPARIPRAWTAEELRKLFACTKYAADVGSVDGPLWWGSLFSCLWDTGERIAAMMSLRWDGVDLDGLTVFLPAEVRKGGQVDRLYPIAEETARLLRRLPREYRPFFWPYDNATLYNRLKGMLLKGGLPADRRSKFHRIRRSTASHYEAAGGNATELLGHTSRNVTRGYLDPRIVKTTSAVDLLFRPGMSDGISDSK
jgi:integrase